MTLPEGYGPALFFSDEGRIGRKGFWAFVLTAVGFAILLLLLVGPRRMVLAHTLFGILMIYPSYCVFAKRLQDIDISGAWAILIVGISAVDLVMGLTGFASRPGFPMTLARIWMHVSNANLAVVTLALGVLPGTAGANRHGPQPAL